MELGKSNSTKYIFPLEFTQFIRPFVQTIPAGGQEDAADSSHAVTTEEMDKLLEKFAEWFSKGKLPTTELGKTEPLAEKGNVPDATKARIIPPYDEKVA